MQSVSKPGNPLATDDQIECDRLALQLYRHPQVLAKLTHIEEYLRAHPVMGTIFEHADPRIFIDEMGFLAASIVANDDPRRPRITLSGAAPHAWRGLRVPGARFGIDNPDNSYRFIPTEFESRYVITGRTYSSRPRDMSFSLMAGMKATMGGMKTLAILNLEDVVIDADGSYTITLDSEPANGRPNHLQSAPGASTLSIRHNLGHWLSDTFDALEVRRVAGPPPLAVPSEVERVARTVDQLDRMAGYFIHIWYPIIQQPTPNRIRLQSSVGVGGLSSQVSCFGSFRIEDDEALIVTLTNPGAHYIETMAYDAAMVSIDPDQRLSCWNNVQAACNDDGGFTVVFSARDPGVHNWVDVSGFRFGGLAVRYQGLTKEGAAAIGAETAQSRLVKFAALNDLLPPHTQHVTAVERTAQIEERARGFGRRWQLE